MTERSPAFQFYAKDWRDVKVRRMSLAAQGAYIAILADMWVDSKDQCSILNHPTFLARALGISEAELKEIFREIQCEHEPLFEEFDSRLYSRRLEQEVMKQRKFSKAQKKRALSRWDKPVVPMACRNDAGMMPDVCSSSSSSSSIEEQEKGITIESILGQWNAITGVKTCRQATGEIRERINRLRKEKTLQWWTDLFASIGKSKFLTGGVSARRPDDRPFRASLSWAIGPKNLSKIEAGDYDDGENTAVPLSCPSHPTKIFTDAKEKRSHDQLYHPKFEG